MCMMENDHSSSLTVAGVRLPTTVAPEHYSLLLRPNMEASTFTGEQSIDLTVKAAVSRIVLNSVGLVIADAYVTNAKGSRLNAKVVSYDVAAEQASIEFDGTIGKGKWKLHLKFTGEITSKLSGFYRSTYKDGAGKEHVIASTQFEPNDARRSFPCFDEPIFKATFQVTLEVDANLTAISNEPIIKVTYPNEGKKLVEFGRTMKMSTYIVAYVIGEFEVTDPIVVNGTEIRAYCVPGKKHLTTYALKAAQFALTWFERYFGIKYPGNKLDLIGIPDFAFGAMENLGCVTFRETALLVSEETATIGELLRVSEVVMHEIAHMWFGDLVTMKWWNGLWLNEAFATFMATKVQDAFRRQWERWVSFGQERAAAMRTDGLASTRSVEAPVNHPAEALGMIDVITYRKGCSVLRQLEQYIGEDTFRDGIRVYLKKHAYSNAETTDLWDAIASVTTLPVREIMTTWVFQPGYPVITVSESAISGGVTLSQAPFKYLAAAVDKSQTWLVPVLLRFKTAEGVGTKWVLLDGKEKSIYLGEQLEWVVVNADGHGFYRTSYSAKLASKLTANMSETLNSIERFNLVNDAWACAQAGLTSAEQYLDIVALFSEERDPNIWGLLHSSLARIYDLLPERNRSVFAKLVRTIVMPQYNRLGWTEKAGESAQDRQVRGTVILMLGTIGNYSLLGDAARQLFGKYKTDRSAVASDVVPAMIALLAHNGGSTEYDELAQLLSATQVPQEKVRFLMAQASFRDVALLEKTLASTITATVRTQDAPSLLVRLLGNGRINVKAWQFIKDNWDYMVANFPETGLISMVSGVTALDRQELETDVIAFFATHPVKGGDKAVAQNLELLRVAVEFKCREAGLLAAKFAMPVVTLETAPVVATDESFGPGPALVRQTGSEIEGAQGPAPTTVLQPSAVVDGPGPELVRQTDSPTTESTDGTSGA